ncbi:hypothetical protein AMATHDRAFT_60987 [Amanita thiersii Skay4041]|uniref:Extracellular membrane protein CFEM domain-containing protein n=1 Tax=Amanita thiersii Skay4041 TaxID=703135 RepID=A0A2A9NRR1_9AGAR|nr:hypothetical protein AMATHDRAFT_60987 [Amanita thiersii Skay4041]
MLHNTLFVSFTSILLASAYATNVHPLLAARQDLSQCLDQCSGVLNLVQSPDCKQDCICKQSTINDIGKCVDCANSVSSSTGQSIPGLGPSYMSDLIDNCRKAGFSVTAPGSSSGSSGTGSGNGSTSGSTSGTGSGNGSTSGTGSGTGSGSTSGTGSGSGSGSGSNSGLGNGLGGSTGGSSGAMGITAQLGTVAAAAIAGVVALA